MDEAERIPIDLGYEVASGEEAGEPSGQRITSREDGTLVIDILAQQPCEASNEGEIVVCAPATDGSRDLTATETEPAPTLMEKVGEALNAKIGPLELGSIDRGDGTRVFGARVPF